MRDKVLIGLLIVTLSGAAQATLIDRGSGMVYDDVLNVTWLSDANLGGLMNWYDSVAWADNLMFGGFDDWRLPLMDLNLDSTIVNCNGATELACRDNELGYMFYHNLMGSFGDDLRGTQGLFTNIPIIHWSGMQFFTDPDIFWLFTFGSGNQGGTVGISLLGTWAVRSGDVLTAVPEPGTLALIGLGLAGLGWTHRREQSGLK